MKCDFEHRSRFGFSIGDKVDWIGDGEEKRGVVAGFEEGSIVVRDKDGRRIGNFSPKELKGTLDTLEERIARKLDEPLPPERGPNWHDPRLKIEKTYRKTWGEVLDLIKKYKDREIFFFSIIGDKETVVKNPDITTFAFDIAVAADEEVAEKIKLKIREYRTAEWDRDGISAMIGDIYTEAGKHPYVIGYWE